MTHATGANAMTDEDDALVPCPFCGGDAAFGEVGGDGDDAGGEFIQCANSDCGASSALIFPLMDDVRDQLRERWNRRPRKRDNPCLTSLAEGEPCKPDAENLRRCTICGFVVDLTYNAEKPAP
jgi:hypothetical protein